MGSGSSIGGIAPENALDALLDELQTFAKPPNHDQQQVVSKLLTKITLISLDFCSPKKVFKKC